MFKNLEILFITIKTHSTELQSYNKQFVILKIIYIVQTNPVSEV